MIKQVAMALAALVASMGCALAQVDVNKADAAALDGIKGIGPKMAKSILDERGKGGAFKDWADFEKRVQGVGEKNARRLSTAGLTVGGKPLDGTTVAAAPKADAKKAATAK
ncbi:ComEA family DNA-binding protein [Massilia sp. PWRC2]|uniref:ComEA family DNA-binding protein n=1 Tax=Massilia sp. PWRC2 TaxID=2804626 RepID=UPI003CE7A77B